MRLWIFSDLHRDVADAWTPPAIPAADVAVVAGDVVEGLGHSIDWLARAIRPHMPVVLVAGNHEFYGHRFQTELRQGLARASAAGITLLADSEATLGGVRFVGGTLWTDYALDRDKPADHVMAVARRFMNDHSRIGWEEDGEPAFGPEQARALHRETRASIARALLAPAPGSARLPTVVVTHHAPHPRSIHPRYAGNPLNGSFASNLSDLIEAGRPELWVHGHTHATLDYRVGATRIVCNPKGYGHENPDFDPALVVKV